MRDLGISEKNEISVFDVSTQKKVTYFYKTITTQDHLEFSSITFKAVQDTGDIQQVQQKQIDYTLSKLTGFEDGYFSINGKPISSDPNSKDYNPGWREILKQYVGDHILSITRILFSESNYVLKKNSALMTNSGNGKMPGHRREKKNT